ncbi:unnamed protein product [Ostreobium quekettii]|uniref:Protein transport protein Sec61 subunit beta n=1 Tax=Ostreobium quekettii TaxID=121088 RepID=A0A8S1INW7_9CHLO|nr:unnamed protein product [Ostreobium quekettii]
MAKGSMSQTSTTAGNRGGGGRGGSTAPPAAALRRRTAGRTSSGTGGPSGGGMSRVSQGLMNFYTDDSPGLKIPPVVVVIMSLGFIGFVTLLHVIGKVRGA